MLARLYHIFSSLKLTVVLLALGLILVFWGTLAQVHLGLYLAQDEFFRNFFVYWSPAGSDLKLPVFPAGYTVGSLLLVNLALAHFRYYQPGQRKVGIVLIHAGVVLLLVGQLLTDVLSSESSLHLRHGETKNYSETPRDCELAVIDISDPDTDQVVAIPAARLAAGTTIDHEALPFTIRVRTHYPNSAVVEKQADGFEPVNTTHGFGTGLWWQERPREIQMDRRDLPSSVIVLETPAGELGSYLVSAYFTQPQLLQHEGRIYQLAMRLRRLYKPFTLHLVEFRHDRYPGTDIPMNFSSRLRLQRPDTGEDREVLIYMNHPLRYAGETYYQASFDRDDQGTVLQVVRNPSWLTPYFSCVIVGVGLIVQFASHLRRFGRRRKQRNAA